MMVVHNQMADSLRRREHHRSALLICLHVIACCASLILVTRYGNLFGFTPPSFHIFYDPARRDIAIATVVAFAFVSPIFVYAPFSFGYFVGFYFYTMILGYLWLNSFTDLNYDHRLAGISAVASAIAFLLPALSVSSPTVQKFALSERAFDQTLNLILVLAVAAIAIGSLYNFRIVSLDDMYYFRERIQSPTSVNYLVTIVSNALLPFAFAGFVARRAPWRAAVTLLLLVVFYPIALSKLALLTPAWLLAMLLLSRIFEARIAVVLSLLVPMLAGLVSLVLKGHLGFFFSTINFRMIAIPSVAMDIYNHFFFRHDLTYFCQISILKPIMHCPYQDQLSVIMQREYGLGNFNASLFATEGIASVGALFAPVPAFVCGLFFAFINRMPAGLPPHFVLISGAILPQVLLNVPVSTVLITHGGVLLFLLWYLTPRTIFEKPSI